MQITDNKQDTKPARTLEKPLKKTGRPPRRPGYSLIARGETPRGRRYVETYLTEVRQSLIEQLGPTEADLSAGQRVLVDRVIAKVGVLRLIEEECRERGVFRPDRQGLVNVLAENYLAWSNSVRLDLMALGIKRGAAPGVPDLAEYIRMKDREAEKSRDVAPGRASGAALALQVGEGPGGPQKCGEASGGLVQVPVGVDPEGEAEDELDRALSIGRDEDIRLAQAAVAKFRSREGKE